MPFLIILILFTEMHVSSCPTCWNALSSRHAWVKVNSVSPGMQFYCRCTIWKHELKNCMLSGAWHVQGDCKNSVEKWNHSGTCGTCRKRVIPCWGRSQTAPETAGAREKLAILDEDEEPEVGREFGDGDNMWKPCFASMWCWFMLVYFDL